MARPRVPRAKAAVEGSDKINPGRFKNRTEPKVNDALGAPPPWLKDTATCKAKRAWQLFANELPWLNSSHRTIVGMAALIQGRIMADQEIGVQAMNLLRQCLGQMGATPADASKVTIPDGEDSDPDAAIFGSG